MQADLLFRSLSDGTRRKVLALLQRHDLSVSELVEVLTQPQSTVSRHLKVLREVGLIRDRRQGNTVMYSVHCALGEREASELPARLLGWVAEQPLPAALRRRLEAVIERRTEMSRRFFRSVGGRWDTLREQSFGSGFHLEALIALAPARWTVADIGTGTGYLLPPLAEHFRQVIGVEQVDAMLEVAGERVSAGAMSNVELRRGDLAHLPIPDDGVDLAIAMLVLHHVPEPRHALSELHRIVRPGARVLIVEQWAHDNEAFRDRMQDRWWGFDPGELRAMMRGVGFDRIRSHRLATVQRSEDAPELFVVTARKRSGNQTDKPRGNRQPEKGEQREQGDENDGNGP